MKILYGVLLEEEERLLLLLKTYGAEIDSRPKGNITYKNIGKGRYAYLNWREGERILTRYLGLQGEEKVLNLIKQIEERKRYQGWLKETKLNLVFLKRILHARRKS